jgi:hypothetical protein
MTISLAEQTMNCYIAGGLERLIPLSRAGEAPGGKGIEPEKPLLSSGDEPCGLVTNTSDQKRLRAPPQRCDGTMGLPEIDASAITTPLAFERMLRSLGFARGFARKSATATFDALRPEPNNPDPSIDDQATQAALERLRAVAQTMRQNHNGQ